MDGELVPAQRAVFPIGRIEMVVVRLGVAFRQEPQVPQCRVGPAEALNTNYRPAGDMEAPPSPGTYIDTFA